jgi:hypothetical protein
MESWKALLNSDQTEWLLEPDNPSVRYFTLTEICGKPDSDAEVKKARLDIMITGIVPKILGKQNTEGYWEAPEAFYTAKYKGTVWQLLILAELAADGGEARIRKACEFILDHSQNLESYGFAINTSAKNGGGRHSEVLPCLTGNMVWSLIKLGYLKDERVQKGIAWINKYQRFDDGDGKPEGWPYDKYEMCWGKHTCHMGAVKAVKALAEIPEEERTKDVRKTIADGIDYLLTHHIYKKSHDLDSVSKPGWMRFGFPLMYQTDILEILLILTKLGCKDKRMQEAINLVLAKQDKEGKWKMENTFNGRVQANIEQKGKASKWITLNSMRVVKRYFSENDATQ